jgi:hypothetical protein
MPNVVDEFTHECPAIRIARRLKAVDVVDVLSDPFVLRGGPEHVRSDDGPEFLAEIVGDRIAAVGARRPASRPVAHGERFRRELRRPPGAEADPEPTIEPGHSVGADQSSRRFTIDCPMVSKGSSSTIRPTS